MLGDSWIVGSSWRFAIWYIPLFVIIALLGGLVVAYSFGLLRLILKQRWPTYIFFTRSNGSRKTGMARTIQI